MSVFKTISIAEAERLMVEQQPILLDCRNVSDYKQGHIANAMHLHEQLRDSLLRKGDKQRPLLIYCYHGHASEHVAEMFSDFGFTAVHSMAGGYSEWLQYHKHTGEL